MYVRKKLSQRGDTIMEVLIAVAVLSLILAVTFNLANRSSKANRQAAERSEGTKYVQSQMETLKYYLGENNPEPSDSEMFCLYKDPVSKALSYKTESISEANIDTNYSAATTCRFGIDGRYVVLFKKTGNTYKAYGRWDSVKNNVSEKISMVHRIYPDLASTPTTITPTPIPPPPTFPYTATVTAFGSCWNNQFPNGNGCPDMRITFTWSDGTQSLPVIQRVGASSATYSFNYTFNTAGLRLSKVDIAMVQDDWGNGGDRNLYVQGYSLNGTSYDHTSSVSVGCTHVPNFDVNVLYKNQCNTAIITYYPGMVSRYAADIRTSCFGLPAANFTCNWDPAGMAAGYDKFVYDCSNFQADFRAYGMAGSKLLISYGDHTLYPPYGCGGAPVPPSNLYNYHIQVFKNDSLITDTTLQPASVEQILEIPVQILPADKVTIKWLNDQWVDGFNYDPDFAIYRIGARP